MRLLCVAVSFAATSPSLAVLISGDDGAANTQAPVDDPGWRYVLERDGYSAVYLGRGWVLTAAHLGARAVAIDGRSYPRLFGSARRLRNPDSSPSDLLLYRIVGDPGLPTLPLAERTPSIGSEVVMIGSGQDRGVAIRASEGGERGFTWATTRSKRWGQNVVHENRYRLEVSGSVTRALAMEWGPNSEAPVEGHAVPGDSGGALFVKRAGVWRLGGILLATSSRVRPASLFGDLTIAGDVASYRDQILAATAIADIAARPRARWMQRLRDGFMRLLP